ncbi:hypothetical protein SS1G_12873 [Sclerotinia sclerotiorum 1980 UF-70]|uniref:MARVEL domain-containing protein n=1 Tax=Sclerotinia sclerotiorum (strain ATCC 18683 / 1980 / Ss-1) TaxID=665079 RepID=A7F5J5_SCLS1|nr:hypothetical protein SS1G_12873 [Sclerotinia sclerotiorum 1980 UF-70]EDN98016.1 hypothetical protein SS1G_12873 [Sclerotinia sclerotiorum 1980 UF-70]
MVYLAPPTNKGPLPPLTRPRSSSNSSTSSSSSSLKVPRTPRFAEATTVYSPVDDKRSPFADPPKTADSYASKTQAYMAQSQPSDIGFGYISENRQSQGVPIEMPLTPSSPLKSALKVPGTPGRMMNPLSPTFREEQILEKHEEMTEIEQAKDLKIKTRVRVAKLLLRFVNFSCSLIVLSMVATTFSIFEATKSLPARNNLPPWADGTKTWPQKVVLAISSVSLALCVLILYNYWKGGHKRAEKVAVYYTLFAVAYFIFSTIMWGIAAGILQGVRTTGNNKDIWGWSCVDNKRRQLFQEKIDYALVCRIQSWSLVCCIIEIVLESLTIAIYSVVFYRYYSKQRLRKSMAIRDRARSDLYLAQLRSQSAPNTPGFGPLSPSYSQYAKSPRFPPSVYQSSPDLEEGNGIGTRFVEAKPGMNTAKPFTLQAPPIRVQNATPKLNQGGFEPQTQTPSPSPPPPPPQQYQQQRVVEHVQAAPGEQTYASVPIPGAYANPLSNQGVQ